MIKISEKQRMINEIQRVREKLAVKLKEQNPQAKVTANKLSHYIMFACLPEWKKRNNEPGERFVKVSSAYLAEMARAERWSDPNTPYQS